MQLATVRFLGTFLSNPAEVPRGVVAYIARQLGIAEIEGLSRYATGEKRWDHAAAIRRHYGYHDFHKGTEAAALTRWLANRPWIGAERPSVLFDLATARLVEARSCSRESRCSPAWSPKSATKPPHGCGAPSRGPWNRGKRLAWKPCWSPTSVPGSPPWNDSVVPRPASVWRAWSGRSSGSGRSEPWAPVTSTNGT